MTGCSALGTSHNTLTGIIPAGYTGKRVDSRLVHAHFETAEPTSNATVDFVVNE